MRGSCGAFYALYFLKMITRYDQKDVAWVDLENPTVDEIASVAGEFELGSDLIEELLTPTARPRVDVYPSFVYTVMHFPALRFTHGLEADHEIDIIFGNTFIITIHYAVASAIYDLAKAFETAGLIGDKKATPMDVGRIFLKLSERLYQAADDELDALEDVIGVIEQNIFGGQEREMVSAISEASRELLTHKRLLGTHRDILEALERATTTLFGEHIARFVRTVETMHYRVHTRAMTMADIVANLRETNTALLYTRQNEIMKNLTVLAFITFPLSLIAGVFGMNTIYTPIVGHPQGFWIIVAGMFTLTALFFAYFKLRRWF